MIAIGGVIVSVLVTELLKITDMRRARVCFLELVLIWLMADLQASSSAIVSWHLYYSQ